MRRSSLRAARAWRALERLARPGPAQRRVFLLLFLSRYRKIKKERLQTAYERAYQLLERNESVSMFRPWSQILFILEKKCKGVWKYKSCPIFGLAVQKILVNLEDWPHEHPADWILVKRRTRERVRIGSPNINICRDVLYLALFSFDLGFVWDGIAFSRKWRHGSDAYMAELHKNLTHKHKQLKLKWNRSTRERQLSWARTSFHFAYLAFHPPGFFITISIVTRYIDL
jgi:hypothetical protein